MDGEHDPAAERPAEDARDDGTAVGAATPPPAPAAVEPPPPPSEPPPYVPPVYGAPASAATYPAPPPPLPPPSTPAPPHTPPDVPPAYGAYSPPPMAAPIPLPSAFQPAPAPVVARRSGPRALMVVAVVAVFLVLVLGGGAIVANASLSVEYSPQRAVTDYLTAQSRGDVPAMLLNASFVKGESGPDQLFDQDAVTAMMAVPENRSITSVSVTSTQTVDPSTSDVSVSMSWNGTPRSQTYVVRRDTKRVHDLFYYSWRVDIPAGSITVTLPNQAGALSVDGVGLPAGTTSVAVIQGFHQVAMAATSLYDADVETADAVDGTASVAFRTELGATALAAARDAVKQTFAGTWQCDPAKYFDCPNHTYSGAAVLSAPGGDISTSSTWIITFEGDPTAGMKLSVSTTSGKVDASGNCAMQLVVDHSKTYHFTGTWQGTLTSETGGFATDLTEACDSARA